MTSRRLADRAGFAARKAASAARRPAARPRHRLLPRDLARRAGRMGGGPLRGGWDRSTLCLGTQSNGQGHETSFPQFAADHLGLPRRSASAWSRPIPTTVPCGNGHGGARSLHVGGTALVQAMDAMLAKARPSRPSCCRRRPRRSTSPTARFTRARHRARRDPRRAGRQPRRPGSRPTARRRARCRGEEPVELGHLPLRRHVAEVEIDPETGAVTLLRYQAVDDYGRLINPLLTAGQVQGGARPGHRPGAAGGGGLRRRLGPAALRLLHGLLPAAGRGPARPRHRLRRGCRRSPIRSASRAPARPGPSPRRRRWCTRCSTRWRRSASTHLDMPLTPEKVWRAIRAAAHASP